MTSFNTYNWHAINIIDTRHETCHDTPSGYFPVIWYHRAGNSPDMSRHARTILCCYRIKMLTEQDQSPCDFVNQIGSSHLHRVAQFASLWCNIHVYLPMWCPLSGGNPSSATWCIISSIVHHLARSPVAIEHNSENGVIDREVGDRPGLFKVIHVWGTHTYKSYIQVIHTRHTYIQVIPTSHTYKSYIQVIHTSHTYKSYIQVIHTSHTYKSYIQVIHTSHTYKSYIQVIHTSHTYKSYILVIHTSHTYKSYIQVIHTSHTYKSYI